MAPRSSGVTATRWYRRAAQLPIRPVDRSAGASWRVVSSLPLWRCTAECGEIEYGELPVAYYPLPQRLSTQSCGDDAPDESPFRRARALRLDALRPTSTRSPSPCAAKSSVTSSRCATLPSTCGTRRAQDLRTGQRMPHRHDGSLPGRPTRRRHLLSWPGRETGSCIDLWTKTRPALLERRPAGSLRRPANANTASPRHCHPSDEPAAALRDRLGVDTGT